MNTRRAGRSKFFTLAAGFLGVLYCLLNTTGADLFCGTRGCEIYAGYGLFGISFYFYGLVAFLAIFLLTIFSHCQYARPLLALTLGLALLLDTLFLIYQALLWPCSSCHVVALLIGISAFAGVKALNLPGRKLLIGVGVVWGVFFIYVGGAAFKEIAFEPWPLYGSTKAPIKIYFSPTCPACEKVVRKVLNHEETAGQTGLYPIAKNSDDEARLAVVLESELENTDPGNVLRLFAPAPQEGPDLNIRNRVRLLSNKIAIASSGATKVPLILSPYIVETGDSGNASTWSIEKVLEDSPGNPFDTGCSTFADDPDCED